MNSTTIYWKILILIFRYVRLYDLDIPRENDWTICKEWRPWSDAAFCGVWSGAALFASYPFGVSRQHWVKCKPDFKLYVEMTIARLLHMFINTSDKHSEA